MWGALRYWVLVGLLVSSVLARGPSCKRIAPVQSQSHVRAIALILALAPNEWAPNGGGLLLSCHVISDVGSEMWGGKIIVSARHLYVYHHFACMPFARSIIRCASFSLPASRYSDAMFRSVGTRYGLS